MEETFIYIIAASENGPVKIGYSERPERRVRQLQTGHATKLKLYFSQPVAKSDARRIEKLIHTTVSYRRVVGEWFDLRVSDAIAEVQVGLMSA